jgi:hypothetical protein
MFATIALTVCSTISNKKGIILLVRLKTLGHQFQNWTTLNAEVLANKRCKLSMYPVKKK